MRLLLTSSRDWTDEDTMWNALEDYLPSRGSLLHTVVLVHGDARGGDRLASTLWTANGGLEEAHPADWKRYGRAAGPIRNQEMVDAGADVCLAFPLATSIGTWDCMRRAQLAGITVINYGSKLNNALLDGSLET